MVVTARTRYEANVCVLLRRGGRWLLSVRSAEAVYAPGSVGLVGGHVEPEAGPDVLEHTARREVAEETGIDLSGVELHYLSSALYLSSTGQPVLTVTFAAELAAGVEARLTAPDELSAVGWWSAAELAEDPRCAPWVPSLVADAGALLDRLAGVDRLRR
ncbi:MAG: NUDIX domain-containing protein [Microlunatus sp.]|nr:NUDIX domain-containing protein [Microlunatus sp.]